MCVCVCDRVVAPRLSLSFAILETEEGDIRINTSYSLVVVVERKDKRIEGKLEPLVKHIDT